MMTTTTTSEEQPQPHTSGFPPSWTFEPRYRSQTQMLDARKTCSHSSLPVTKTIVKTHADHGTQVAALFRAQERDDEHLPHHRHCRSTLLRDRKIENIRDGNAKFHSTTASSSPTKIASRSSGSAEYCPPTSSCDEREREENVGMMMMSMTYVHRPVCATRSQLIAQRKEERASLSGCGLVKREKNERETVTSTSTSTSLNAPGGRTRSDLLARRKLEQTQLSAKFEPRKAPGIHHQALPFTFTEKCLATDTPTYWWQYDPAYVVHHDASNSRDPAPAQHHYRTMNEIAYTLREPLNQDVGTHDDVIMTSSARSSIERWTDDIIKFQNAPDLVNPNAFKYDPSVSAHTSSSSSTAPTHSNRQHYRQSKSKSRLKKKIIDHRPVSFHINRSTEATRSLVNQAIQRRMMASTSSI